MSYRGYPNATAASTYGARNYGQRASGRHNKSHNTSDTSHSSAGKNASADLSLHNGVRPGGMSRSSGRRSSGRRSSGRRSSGRNRHHRPPMYNQQGASFETASTVSSSASILPPSTVRSNGTASSFGSSASPTAAPRPPPAKKGLFNFTGRGIGATIAVVAGIVLGGTGLMMLVMGFSGGTAMLVLGPCLMVAGVVAIGVGAGLCICCRGKKESDKDVEVQPPSKEASFDDLNSSQPSTLPPRAGSMLGGANVNLAYRVDGAEDSIDTVPTVAAQVPPSQYTTNAYAQPQAMKSQPRMLVTSSAPAVVSAAPAPVFAPAPTPVTTSTGAPHMVQTSLVGAAPLSINDSLSSSMESSSSCIVDPVSVSSIHQRAPLSMAPAPPAPAPAPAPEAAKSGKVQKPRAKLSLLTPSEPAKPAVKLPVPVRGPVVNLNPMPQPKQRGRARSASPSGGVGNVPISPQTSSFSENSEFSSSADESGNRINSSETDASVTENGQRKHRVKKRVSFSDDDKKAKRAKRKLRNSKEHNEAVRTSLDGEMPKSILAAKSGAEDFKYIGPPNAVRKNTAMNRGRSQSPQRSSQRQSRRTRSQSPHQQKQRPPPDPTMLHNGPRPHAPAAPAQRSRPPLDQNDPAVQSRLRRNSRRRSKERQPRRAQPQQQQYGVGVENQGYVNEAMDLSPTQSSPPQLSPEHNAPPIASSSPNTSMVNNNNMKAEGVSNWAPIHSSTPPGTPKPAVLQLANFSQSSTETEI